MDNSVNVYWKVHKNNIKDMYIVGLPDKYIQNYQNDDQLFIDNYIYISFDDNVYKELASWGFMFYRNASIDWYQRHNYRYLGEFNLRKQKLQKINENGI